MARDHEARASLEVPLVPPADRVHFAGEALRRAYEKLARSALHRDDLPPGAAWILDNFYLVRDQTREILLGLSPTHYRQLPRLRDGPYAGAPRIYEVMSELVRALDHAVGEPDLTTMLRAYQEVSELALGELWATPAAFRIVLLERLAVLATAEVEADEERLAAAEWARRIARGAAEDPARGVIVAGELFEGRPRLSDAFVLELAERLRPRGSSVRPVLEWIDRRLERRELTIEDIVRQETQRHVSLSNAFLSLRWASTARWGPWVERVSIMERVLRLDPLHVYPAMDFETRDRYRQRVEALARGSGLTERQVAERAVQRARQADGRASEDEVSRHVGHHLIGAGRDAFEEAIGFRPAARERLLRALRRHPNRSFFGAIALFAVALAAPVFLLARSGAVIPGASALIAAVAILPLLDVAVALANRTFAYLVPPSLLPKLSRRRGIGADERALVVVPTLLSSPEDARRQSGRLEILSFGNPDPNLRFALLTDFTDAPREEMPGDEEILAAAVETVRGLNARHRDEWGDRFFLLHRGRRWSETERCWMGWERKRGKLEELNSLLRHPGGETSFSTIEGDFFAVTGGDRIRYVITLDADTSMPPLAALDLVRTAAHPLNRARYDPEAGRVTRGYGIIQPRVAIEASRAPRTPFARIASGHVGLDPYTHAVSDTYQDLFGEGIYTGKGLYDVDAFTWALEGVIPPGAVLSHDLLESTFVRAGLATDIVFFDDFPSHYIPWARRLHRWVRGDWQILPWLLARIRVRGGRRAPNPIQPLGRWQIFDNIRRSLTPFGLLAFLATGWLLLPQAALWWTLMGLGVLAFPVYVNVTTAVFERPPHVTWSSWLERVADELGRNAVQSTLVLVLLTHQALHQLDAAGRALVRMTRRRHLLQWMTAHQVESEASRHLRAYIGFMWPGTAVGSAIGIAVAVLSPGALPFALPFAIAWTASPFIAWLLSRAPVREVAELSAIQIRRLRTLGRSTWAYFEDHWGAEHGWLPPDNLQLDPFRGVAPRTSPTNIGLGLVAAQCAYEFGWITRDRFLDLVERTLETIERLEKHRGHLYNWYGTESGARLWPPYVSTADSGNLAASLIVLAAGLDGIARAPRPDPALFQGLADTARAAAEVGDSEALRDAAEAFADALPEATPPLRSWSEVLRRVEPLAARLETAGRPAADGALPDAEVRRARATARLAGAALATVRAQLAELESEPFAARARAARLAEACRSLFEEMDFSFLYAPRRGLMTIGYNVETRRQDPGAYDLLASEARLASLVAAAKGDVPTEHWFRLGRPVIEVGRRATLLSWGGTMFEYLMPLVFTPSFQPTLLADSYVGAVEQQRVHGDRLGLPWGCSESQYAAVNAELDYRYRAFGVPGLGLRRGLADDYVVAPYAAALALMVDPRAAFENLAALEEMGATGVYGFYEAVDFTRSRLPAGQDRFIVRTFMAHHAGMALGALCNAVLDGRIQDLFLSSLRMRSTELLLQERVPSRVVSTIPHPLETDFAPAEAAPVAEAVDHVRWPDRGTRARRGLFLSNGRLRTYLHEDGTGGVSFEDRALIRSDPVDPRSTLGLFFYIRDLESGRFWSATHEPVRSVADRLELWFHLNKLEVARVEDWIETFVEAVVSSEDDVDVRRLTITNYSNRPRRLEVTSYAEVVLDDPRADSAHPAFSKLFVHTERSRRHEALFATRRPREAGTGGLWLVHALAFDRARLPDPTRFETDRERFIGRGRDLDHPRAMDPGVELSGTAGSVLDPIVSLRKPFTLGPGEKVQLAFSLGAARHRDGAEALADLYDNPAAAERAIGLATTSATLERQLLGIDGERMQAYQQLASAVHTGNPILRAPPATLARGRGAQSDLWRHGISGDLPIIVARLQTGAQLQTASWLCDALTYWRRKGFALDLVFLNEHGPSYLDELQKALERLVEAPPGGRSESGGTYVLRADQLPESERLLLLTAARAVLDEIPEFPLPAARRPRPGAARSGPPAVLAPQDPEPRAKPGLDSSLFSYNGLGGFDVDRREYVIHADPDAPPRPPDPWINVIASPGVGFFVSEAGSGCTWSVNSRQRRLSPWSNDPVRDPAGEALYVRDEDADVFWSPLPSPAGPPRGVEVRHGMGYSTFRSERARLDQEVTLHADLEHPVKLVSLRLRNLDDASRNLSVFFYLEWVLGVHRSETAPHVVTEIDREARLLLARNSYDEEFAERVAFVVADPQAPEFDATCDRAAFLGPEYDPRRPRALRTSAALDGRDGAGLDPCAAVRVALHLAPAEERTLLFAIGDAGDEAAARALAARIREPGAARDSLERTRGFWRSLTSRVTVRTPSPELDVLVNGWLLYQTLSCRLWGRTAFYQSGGAFGFRDQLQDVMALVYARPDVTREQILLHAGHQFVEGDVLHWWHPPGHRGIRTRITDDLLWLPYVTCFYVTSTGDVDLLSETVPYLEARPLEEDEHEAYLDPHPAGESGDVYDHCCRAIERSLRFGSHGLPLMGTGDWNDGMNRVGEEGRGESVWLGFFLVSVLDAFLPFVRERGDAERAERFADARASLAAALEEAGWDGEWYRRAYFDDGTPLGSSENEECRIDAIAQAWALLSGVASPERGARALASAERLLLDREARLFKLLTPPFELSEPDPGYIQGYPPGIRENGGQYTHGALWIVKALAERGEGDRAVRLLGMMAPPNQARSLDEALLFRNEPYVVTADVYSVAPHAGRGGWSWYTGSGGWMYRVALESILGFRLEGGDAVRITPCIASDWDEFRIEYLAPDMRTRYEFHIGNPDGAQRGIARAEIDGRALPVEGDSVRIELTLDGGRHEVRIRLGSDGPIDHAMEGGAHGSADSR